VAQAGDYLARPWWPNSQRDCLINSLQIRQHRSMDTNQTLIIWEY